MTDKKYSYLIIGGGLAGDKAVEGIREVDSKGSVLIVGSESHRPYHRPPLSKDLWTGKKKVEQVFVHKEEFYAERGVEVLLERKIVSIDADRKQVRDDRGDSYGYGKLLLATGGTPRALGIPGGDLPGTCYFRYLQDYLQLREKGLDGKRAVVIGGGFIGSEMAAALNMNKVEVTMLYPAGWLCDRVFPQELGRALQEQYEKRGIKVISGDRSVACEPRGGKIVTKTGKGLELEADLVIAGIGILPSVDLAVQAGLSQENGIEVNERLETSRPDIYAAGDNASFPYQALGMRTRVEHWDNSLNQGKQAGRNMAGVNENYSYMPYFFSDLFE